jgi:hypothetical protein
MHTQPLSIEVLPRPETYPDGTTWLPARALTLEESWSADPGQLEVGASVTRTIRLRGEGLQGAQLPPLEPPRVEGLKFYPDQPDISDAESASGLLGTRTDSSAIVPTAAGTVVLPEVRLPWWDTESGSLRYAILPPRTLTIAPAARPVASPTPGATAVPGNLAATPAAAPGTLTWQIATAVCALGWLVTLFLWLRPRVARHDNELDAGEQPSRRAAYRQLMAACTANHAAQARQWFIRWSSAAWDDPAITSAAAAVARWNTPELDSALQALEASLFAPAPAAIEWRGDTLGAIVKGLENRPRAKHAGENDGLAPLYPGARAAT